MVITAMASPFVGCFAATAVRASLTGEAFLQGRSYCPECRRESTWRDLVPLFSWLLSLGACRRCRSPISFLYPSLELGFFAVTLWASQLDQTERFLPAILLGWILDRSFCIRHHRLRASQFLDLPASCLRVSNCLEHRRRCGGGERGRCFRGSFLSPPGEVLLSPPGQAGRSRDGRREALCGGGGLGWTRRPSADFADRIVAGAALCGCPSTPAGQIHGIGKGALRG